MTPLVLVKMLRSPYSKGTNKFIDGNVTIQKATQVSRVNIYLGKIICALLSSPAVTEENMKFDIFAQYTCRSFITSVSAMPHNEVTA